MRRAPLAALVLAAASALAGGAASAQQQVQVLSGEHDGFSRLVFRLRPDLPHEVSTRPGLVRIKFPGRHLVFDVSGLFDKLSRERLVSVRQTGAAGGSVLQLNLACACEPFVFPFRGNYLVVDIRDPGVGAVTAAQPQPQPEPAAVAPRRGERGIYATADTRPLLDGLDAAAAGPVGEAPPELPASDPAAAEPDDETWRNLRHAHDALLQQLSRAVEQGLIALADPDTAPAARTAGEQTGRAMPGPDDERAGPSAHRAGPSPPPPAARDARIFADLPAPGAKSDGAPEPPGNDRRQVAVTTVFDRDDPPAGEQPHPALRCPDAADLMIWTWADDTPAYLQLTAARAGLLGEFDRPDPAALRRLAKTYLAFGFGREALALIEAFDKEMEDTALLADLALAVEGQQAVADGPLDRARGCGGVAAVLRGASLGFDAPPDGGLRASLFAAFSEMPARQRRLFGPPLSAALLSVGDSAGARRISGIAARAPGDDTPGQSLLAARLDLAAGPDEHSLAVLRRLGLAAQAEAPEALALLVGELVSHGRDVPPEVMSALALAQFENRGTDVGRRLLAIRIRALIAAGSAATAYETLAAALRDAGPVPGESAMAAAVLMAYRPGAASPAEYARRVWRLLPRLGSDEEADAARAAVAAGLTEIGLPNLAPAALQPAQGRGRAGVRLAAAKAYLAEGRPRRALGVVAGLPAATAAPVAARALAEMGDPAAALRRLRDTGASGAPALLDFAWQAGDWKTASGVADGPRRALAAFMLSRPGDGVARRRRAGGIAEPGEPPVTLGAMRRQLARSAETRDLVARAVAAEAPASK